MQKYFQTASSDGRFPVSLLFAITGFALVLQNPQAQETAVELISNAEMPNLERIVEFRPQTPPPGVESDQVASDEGPDLRTVPVMEREVVVRSGSLRERPSR